MLNFTGRWGHVSPNIPLLEGLRQQLINPLPAPSLTHHLSHDRNNALTQ